MRCQLRLLHETAVYSP